MLETFLVLAAVAAGPTPAPPVCIAPHGVRVQVDLAIKDDERFLGHMLRDSLPAAAGMLFVFPEDERWPFWMKNTFIALDLVWLDGHGVVVDVRAGVQPCRTDPCPSYTPVAKARAVLEVNAGFAKAHGLAAGTRVRCENVPDYPLKGQTK